jgi:hypothetical protein
MTHFSKHGAISLLHVVECAQRCSCCFTTTCSRQHRRHWRMVFVNCKISIMSDPHLCFARITTAPFQAKKAWCRHFMKLFSRDSSAAAVSIVRRFHSRSTVTCRRSATKMASVIGYDCTLHTVQTGYNQLPPLGCNAKYLQVDERRQLYFVAHPLEHLVSPGPILPTLPATNRGKLVPHAQDLATSS